MKIAIAILIFLGLICSCKDHDSTEANQSVESKPESVYTRTDCNAVYYWKTRFKLNQYESAFLQKNSVKRMYLRLFDVDLLFDPIKGGHELVPVGTVVFDEKVPEGMEIVPVVFITVRAMESVHSQVGFSAFANMLVTRIMNMSDFNDLGAIHEVQLDCDWTERTKQPYYDLCREVRQLLSKNNSILSSTIRLHQLFQEHPPVDRGVLMLYNTGAVKSQCTSNSIVDVSDVRLYLKNKPIHYDLPLDFAYPTYGWGVWFRDGQFMGLLHQTDYGDATRYVRESDGLLRVRSEHVLEGHLMKVGDRIRPENSPYKTIAAVQDCVEEAFAGQPHSNILYHLDSLNLCKFSEYEIHTLYLR